MLKEDSICFEPLFGLSKEFAGIYGSIIIENSLIFSLFYLFCLNEWKKIHQK